LSRKAAVEILLGDLDPNPRLVGIGLCVACTHEQSTLIAPIGGTSANQTPGLYGADALENPQRHTCGRVVLETFAENQLLRSLVL